MAEYAVAWMLTGCREAMLSVVNSITMVSVVNRAGSRLPESVLLSATDKYGTRRAAVTLHNDNVALHRAALRIDANLGMYWSRKR